MYRYNTIQLSVDFLVCLFCLCCRSYFRSTGSVRTFRFVLSLSPTSSTLRLLSLLVSLFNHSFLFSFQVTTMPLLLSLYLSLSLSSSLSVSFSAWLLVCLSVCLSVSMLEIQDLELLNLGLIYFRNCKLSSAEEHSLYDIFENVPSQIILMYLNEIQLYHKL